MNNIIMVLILIISATLSYATESLVFSSSDSKIDGISILVLKEAYKKIGIEITTREFPFERALIMSNGGNTDGEVNRMEGIDKKYNNLIRVPVAINKADGVVFTKNKIFEVKGWDSLKPYSIGALIGVKFIEEGLENMNVEKVGSGEQLFKKLEFGRNDIVVTERVSGMEALNKYKITGIQILEPPLASISLYHYIHKKNIQILPKITDALKEMEKSGRIKEIYENEVKNIMRN